MKFSATNQPTGKRGRPTGSKDKKAQFTKELTDTAMTKLTEAVSEGESWALQLIFNKTHPSLKPITPTDSLDGDLLRAKIKEVAEFEDRLIALENQANDK